MFLALLSVRPGRIWRSLFSRCPLKNFLLILVASPSHSLMSQLLKIISAFIIIVFVMYAISRLCIFHDFFMFTFGVLNDHQGENMHLNCVFFIPEGFQQRRHWASLHIDFTCPLVESSRDLTWHQDDHCCLLICPSFTQVYNSEVKFPDLSCFRTKLYLFSACFHVTKKQIKCNPRRSTFCISDCYFIFPFF